MPDPITLKDSFRPLLYKFHELISGSDKWDPAIRPPLEDLLALLLYSNERTILKLRTTRSSGMVEYVNLWMAFDPGEIVVHVELESCTCFILEEVSNSTKDGQEMTIFSGM